MLELLTPPHILNSDTHDTPCIIFLEDFTSFDDLLKVRADVRDLKLVPIKSDEMQKYYHSFDKKELLKTINFNKSNFLFLENKFPYLLPKDVSQNIIWIKENTPQKQVYSFINKKITEIGNDIILFERPFGIKTKLVKPSFPFLRHIHFWYKKI